MKPQVKYILLKVYWEYEISSIDVIETFGLARAQASNYFSEVKKTCPEAIKYNASLKRYVPDFKIEKYLPSNDFQEYLNTIVPLHSHTYNVLPNKPVMPVVLYRMLRKAIVLQQALTFNYHSLSSASEKNRTVYPHSLINSGYRWHLRGWELESKRFKDFNLSRIDIDKIALFEKPDDRGLIVNDHSWNNEVAIMLIPNSGLSAEERKIVSMDFNMRDGILTLFCKEALLLYTLNSYLVTDFSEKPPKNQLLAIGNLDSISRFLPKN